MDSDQNEPSSSNAPPIGAVDISQYHTADKLYNLEEFDKDERKVIDKLIKMTEGELLQIIPTKKGSSTGKSGPYLGADWETKEARILYVHKMSLRGIANDVIAQQLKVSTRTVYTLKQEVNRRIKEQMVRIDFGLFAGTTCSFFEEVRSSCMVMASSKTVSDRDKLYAFSTAMKAQNDMIRFLDMCKVFNGLSSDNVVAGAFSSHGQKEDDEVQSVMDSLADALKDHIPQLESPTYESDT